MRVDAVVLAAGASRRFGGGSKLLAEVAGRPLLRRVAEAVAASRAEEILVVVPPDAGGLREALAGLPLRVVENLHHAAGMGASIASGVRALDPACEAALIVPGDLPGLTAQLIDRLIAVLEADPGRPIVYAATAAGAQRNPVLWPRRHFHRLAALAGEAGGKAILAEQTHETRAVPVADESQLADVDTPEDLAAFLGSR